MAGPVVHPLPTNTSWKPLEAVPCTGCLSVGAYSVIGSIVFGNTAGVTDTLHLTARDHSRNLTWNVPIRFEPPVYPLTTAASAAGPAGDLSGSCTALPDGMVPTPRPRPKVVQPVRLERSRSREFLKTKAAPSGAFVGTDGFGRSLRYQQPPGPPPKHTRKDPRNSAQK